MDSDTVIPATVPVDVLKKGAPPQKFIRTYSRDMATVQRGGTPDLVPLGPQPQGPGAVRTSSSGIKTILFAPTPATPAESSVPALIPETAGKTEPPAVSAPPPADAVVVTYEQGLREGAERAQRDIPASPAAVSWRASEEEREEILSRLEEKARSIQSPSEPPPPPPPPPRLIQTETPPAVPIAPPASPLSVPAYSTSFTLGVPGEPVPKNEPPPPPPAPPSPPIEAEAPSPFVLAPYVPPPPPPPAPPPVFVHEEFLSPIHTYTTDFSAEVGATRASAATILAAEADAHRGAPLPVRSSPTEGSHNRRYAFVAIVLVLVGAGALFAAYARYYANTSPIRLAFAPTTPIFVDEREEVAGQGTQLLQALEQAVGRPLADGSVRLLYQATSSDTSVFNSLRLSAPDILLRNIVAAGSMAGVVSVNGTQTPFFILSVTSYGDTFSGMLAWEPSMVRTLAKLYPARSMASVPATASSTSISAPALSSAISPPPARESFVDEVIANHDTRIYRDSAGRSILVYGYWNQTTLVIARDEPAWKAILARLASARSH